MYNLLQNNAQPIMSLRQTFEPSVHFLFQYDFLFLSANPTELI